MEPVSRVVTQQGQLTTHPVHRTVRAAYSCLDKDVVVVVGQVGVAQAVVVLRLRPAQQFATAAASGD